MTPRLTLIACDNRNGELDWALDSASNFIMFIDTSQHLFRSVAATLSEPTLDVERLILDRSASAELFLDLLAHLPPDFGGDVLRIDDRGCGFLSATGRGGDRLLYALKSQDVQFYLAAHDLVRPGERLEKIA
jgi:hypothetical protein